MVIKGIFINGCAFIEARLISNSLQIDEKVTFLVDTGASRTTILDKDALRLGIVYDKLPKSKSPLLGIGGSISCFIIADSVLIFRSSKRDTKVRLPIFIAKHPLERMDIHLKTQILRLPSLLGRDIINKYKLIFNFPKRSINLMSSSDVT
jgi:hypothetical protein